MWRHGEPASAPTRYITPMDVSPYFAAHIRSAILRGVPEQATHLERALKGWASQRSLHNEPIFRLLLKVAVMGTR